MNEDYKYNLFDFLFMLSIFFIGCIITWMAELYYFKKYDPLTVYLSGLIFWFILMYFILEEWGKDTK